mmetsp:Transcript_53230/g.141356  ORF Transcript_53230/g.141356 Transcript_53230/m.141356 type:complete len:249 (+) Transcript_53230:329-1075(+)
MTPAKFRPKLFRRSSARVPSLVALGPRAALAPMCSGNEKQSNSSVKTIRPSFEFTLRPRPFPMCGKSPCRSSAIVSSGESQWGRPKYSQAPSRISVSKFGDLTNTLSISFEGFAGTSISTRVAPYLFRKSNSPTFLPTRWPFLESTTAAYAVSGGAEPLYFLSHLRVSAPSATGARQVLREPACVCSSAGSRCSMSSSVSLLASSSRSRPSIASLRSSDMGFAKHGRLGRIFMFVPVQSMMSQRCWYI